MKNKMMKQSPMLPLILLLIFCNLSPAAITLTLSGTLAIESGTDPGGLSGASFTQTVTFADDAVWLEGLDTLYVPTVSASVVISGATDAQLNGTFGLGSGWEANLVYDPSAPAIGIVDENEDADRATNFELVPTVPGPRERFRSLIRMLPPPNNPMLAMPLTLENFGELDESGLIFRHSVGEGVGVVSTEFNLANAEFSVIPELSSSLFIGLSSLLLMIRRQR